MIFYCMRHFSTAHSPCKTPPLSWSRIVPHLLKIPHVHRNDKSIEPLPRKNADWSHVPHENISSYWNSICTLLWRKHYLKNAELCLCFCTCGCQPCSPAAASASELNSLRKLSLPSSQYRIMSRLYLTEMANERTPHWKEINLTTHTLLVKVRSTHELCF